MTCERLWEVDALRDGRLSHADAAAHRRHAAVCAECRDRFAADEQVAALGRALPAPELDPLEARRLRAKILRLTAGAAPAPRLLPKWAVVLLAAAVGVAAVAGVRRLTRPPPEVIVVAAPIVSAHVAALAAAEPFAGTVTASAGARWSRRREKELERTELDDGTLSFEVRRQRPSERFVVVVPDGEIEVRGTTFDVTVNHGATKSVRVDEGKVVFRHDGDETTLERGQSWPKRPPAPAVSMAPASGASGASGASVASGASGASEYAAAVSAYHAGDFGAAADRFAVFRVAHPSAPEVEDASFLEASALARSGRPAAAAAAASRFLASYPASFHARDASLLIARAARDGGARAQGDSASIQSASSAVPASSTR